MTALDIILFVPVIYGFVRGIFRGLVGELTAIIAILTALILTKLFAPETAAWLMQCTGWQEYVCQACSYLVIFFSVALAATLLGKFITRLIKAISLGWLNRLTGAVFGAAKWLLIVSVVLNGVIFLDDFFHFIPAEQREQSVACEPIKSIASVAWDEVKNIQLPETTLPQ